MPAFLLSLFLAAYNNLLNFWRPFHGWIYLPLNLLVASLIVGMSLGLGGLRPEDLGLAHPAAALLGLLIGLLAAAPFFVLLSSREGSRVIADRRFEDETSSMIAYRMLIRVPLGTALLEELAFRGALFALLKPHGTVAAVLSSSIVFGLWHIGPTIHTVQANRPSISWTALAKVVGGAVVFATFAGLVLASLRLLTGSLAAPFAVHATFNSLATLAAWLACRRVPAIVET